jgi:hypothetical protein
MRRYLALLYLSLILVCTAFAQSTFRGGMAGIVTDSSGAIIPGALIQATDIATGVVSKTTSSSAGDYTIQDLPLGDYNVVATYTGFEATKINAIRISAGTIFSLPITLKVGATTQTVEVDAAALTLDTTTVVKTFTVPEEEVQDIPINGRSFTQMTTFLPGNTTGTTRYLVDGVDNNDIYSGGAASNQGGVDGIPGTLLPMDSIDEYSAETQNGSEGGGFSGTTVNLAIKSGTNKIHGEIYNFNRNEFFAAIGPFTKWAISQGQTRGKAPIRFDVGGGAIGGPFIKDRAFYFLNYERQQYVLSQAVTSQTEPSAAWVNEAVALLNIGGVNTNPNTNATLAMMENLITTLWQPSMITGPAALGNWTPPTSAAQNGFSNNFMLKLDQTLNAKNKLSERYYLGQGTQTAPLSTSQNPWYYQVAGERVDNIAAIWNSTLNSKASNQLLLGVDYYNQPFADSKPNGGAAATGFIVGTGPGATFGQPGIAISGFDGTGGTSLQIRNDYSGHITETYTIVLGKHSIRAGGEYRRREVFAIATGRGSSSIYNRGTFSFSGSRGFNAASGGNGTSYPTLWPTGSAYCGSGATCAAVSSQAKALADYLQGEGSSAQLYNGNLNRNVNDNNFNLFVQDNFQLTHSLNINYGLRWDIWTPVADNQNTEDLTVFRPGTAANSLDLTGGLAVVGKDISKPYNTDYLQLAPRLGIAWKPTFLPKLTSGMVVRLGAGLYFDNTGLGTWIYATSLAGNPAGLAPLYNENLTSENIVPGVSIFPANAATSLPNNGSGGPCIGATKATCPNLGISAVDQNYTVGNTTNLSASVEKALGSKALIEVSYVGERGRHLANSYDQNQTAYGATTNTAITNGFSNQQINRPYYTQYPNFAKITDTSSFGASDANALQARIRIRNYHGLISEVSYALSHSSGTGTIEDYHNPALDYGSNSVITDQVKGYWTYDIPNFVHGQSLLSKWVTGGWQTTGTLQFHGAAAITASATGSCNQSTTTGTTYATTCSGLGVGEGAGRASLTTNPRFCPSGNCGGTLATGVTGTSRSTITSGGYIQWFNPYAVISPPGCSQVIGANSTGANCSLPLTSYYGTTHPGQIHGAPGFGDVDLSVFKNLPISERIKMQFRGEMFNLFNRINYAKPSLAAGNTAADPRYGGANIADSTSTGQISTTIGGTSDPGITEGEPFNVQLGLKIMF